MNDVVDTDLDLHMFKDKDHYTTLLVFHKIYDKDFM